MTQENVLDIWFCEKSKIQNISIQYDTTFIKKYLLPEKAYNNKLMVVILGSENYWPFSLCFSEWSPLSDWAYIYFVIIKIILKRLSYSTVGEYYWEYNNSLLFKNTLLFFTATVSPYLPPISSSLILHHLTGLPALNSSPFNLLPQWPECVPHNPSMTLPGSKGWTIMTTFLNTTWSLSWSAGFSLTIGLASPSAPVLSSWWVPAPGLPCLTFLFCSSVLLLDLLADLPFKSQEWLSGCYTSTSLCWCMFHTGQSYFVHFLPRDPQRHVLALHCNHIVPDTCKYSAKFCWVVHTDKLPWAESQLDLQISPFCESRTAPLGHLSSSTDTGDCNKHA